jgi:ABC-type polysaccharide/polyol phosphate export permease
MIELGPALNALFRDVRYVIPFVLQFWMFASPVSYPSMLVPEKWRLMYGLNPMAGVIDGFRWAITGRGHALVVFKIHCRPLRVGKLQSLISTRIGMIP